MRRAVPDLEILADASSLAERAAGLFAQMAGEAARTVRRFAVALAGGSTPRQMYVLLAEPAFSSRVDWSRVHFFWGDERCVPPDHSDSNYRMVQEALLNHVPIPAGNIHRIPGELSPVDAARAYEHELQGFFVDGIPRFDLILLGLGEDGHTASLFPGSEALRETKRQAVAVSHSTPPPPLVDRVTLTLPVLNAAANVIFLVAGAGKAERLAQVLNGPFQPDNLPAQAVRPVSGYLLWLVDQAAAAEIPTLDRQCSTARAFKHKGHKVHQGHI